MSRTDVHTPFWVKKTHVEWRNFFVEVHHHDKHPCNFSIENENWGDCLLGTVNRGRNIYCGCNLCTGQVARRLNRRVERQTVKRLLRSERWDEAEAKRRPEKY